MILWYRYDWNDEIFMDRKYEIFFVELEFYRIIIYSQCLCIAIELLLS